MKALLKTASVLGATLLLCGTLSAQTSLCTLFASNNWGSLGGCVYFDVAVSQPLTITAFDCNFYGTGGTPAGLNVYTCPGGYSGSEANPAAWTLVANDNGLATSSPQDTPTAITLLKSFTLNPSMTYGIALEAIGQQHAYTNGTGTNQNYSNTFMKMALGSATNVPFSGSPFSPRVWNGCIYWAGGCTTKYGMGCPGSKGCVPDLSMQGCATAGQKVQLDVTNGYGGNLAFFFFGAGQGPVPMGAGCYLNMSKMLPVSFALPLAGVGPCAGTLAIVGVVPAGTTGAKINMQVFVQDKGGALGFSNTNGLEFVIQ